MTNPTFLRALRAFLGRRPFQPFGVELLSGDRIRVSHPELIGVRFDVVIYHTPQTGFRLFDCTTVAQLLDLPPAAAA